MIRLTALCALFVGMLLTAGCGDKSTETTVNPVSGSNTAPPAAAAAQSQAQAEMQARAAAQGATYQRNQGGGAPK
jgi:hypothetical protein